MKYFKIILTGLFCIFLVSCNEEHEISKERLSKMSVPEKISYVYDAFLDTATVSRMLNATPENLAKIQKGVALPSPTFTSHINNVCNYYYTSDFNNPKTLREFDPNFSWYDKVWDCDSLYGWYWFWGTLVVVFLICIISENGSLLAILSIFYLICGGLSFIFFVTADPIEKEPYPSVITNMAKHRISNKSHGAQPLLNTVDKRNTTSGSTSVISSDSINNDSSSLESQNATESSKTESINNAVISNTSTGSNFRLPTSSEWKKYSQAYDALILNGVPVDSISYFSGIKIQNLIKMRYGLFETPKAIAINIESLSRSIDEDELDNYKADGNLSRLSLKQRYKAIPIDVIDSIQLSRNEGIEEAMAILSAQCYSEKVSEYLDSKFGLFSSTWQGIKYIFVSKDDYTKSFEDELLKLIESTHLSDNLVVYINGYKHTIEQENWVLTKSKSTISDFTILQFDSKTQPLTDEVKKKIAARGALEASDLGYEMMEIVLTWLIGSVILSWMCNYMIQRKCNKELEELCNLLRPKSMLGKIIVGAVKIGTQIYNSATEQRIRNKYATYKVIADVSIPIVGYIVTYIWITKPALQIENEINQLLTTEFITYYQSADIPLKEIFTNLIMSI